MVCGVWCVVCGVWCGVAGVARTFWMVSTVSYVTPPIAARASRNAAWCRWGRGKRVAMVNVAMVSVGKVK